MHNDRLYALGQLAIQIVAALFPGLFFSQSPPVDGALAHSYFQEAEAVCKRDGGKLWGVSLCGPMLFVDRATRRVVANQSDREGHLAREGDVFAGKLPERVNIANMSVEWAGVKWTMVVWPLPEDKHARADIMAHELWHRIQEEVGLPLVSPSNSHLDSAEGRIWLQLEWRALQEALRSRDARRRAAVEDALTFRAYRRQLFPKAEPEERALETHEGLASYTGAKLSGRADIAQHVIGRLAEAEKTDTFVRSFAYVSGPAYGILLDEAGASWRKGLKPGDDLGLLLQRSLAIKPPGEGDVKGKAARASGNYGGGLLRASETEREEKRLKLVAAYRAKLIDGPVLVLPLQKMQMQFNPDNVQPLDSFGTVYPDIRIVDGWGVLTVSKGALMSPSFDRIQVPAPSDPGGQSVQGDGWTLQLEAGWSLAPGERKGDFILKKSQGR